MKNIVFLILGGIFFLLGIAGCILPIVPQIPFFILAVFFLSAGSEKIKRRIESTTVFQKYLEPKIEKSKLLSKIFSENTEDESNVTKGDER